MSKEDNIMLTLTLLAIILVILSAPLVYKAPSMKARIPAILTLDIMLLFPLAAVGGQKSDVVNLDILVIVTLIGMLVHATVVMFWGE